MKPVGLQAREPFSTRASLASRLLLALMRNEKIKGGIPWFLDLFCGYSEFRWVSSYCSGSSAFLDSVPSPDGSKASDDTASDPGEPSNCE